MNRRQGYLLLITQEIYCSNVKVCLMNMIRKQEDAFQQPMNKEDRIRSRHPFQVLYKM